MSERVCPHCQNRWHPRPDMQRASVRKCPQCQRALPTPPAPAPGVRAWWIDPEESWVSVKPDPNYETVHVIEQSDYAQVCKERDELKAAYETLDNWHQANGIHRITQENRALRDQVDTLSYHGPSDYAKLKAERDSLSDWNKTIQRELDGRTKALQDMLKAKDALSAQLAEAQRIGTSACQRIGELSEQLADRRALSEGDDKRIKRLEAAPRQLSQLDRIEIKLDALLKVISDRTATTKESTGEG